MRNRGFTLVEALVVLIVVVVIASILWPVGHGSQEKGRQTTCCSQVRQLTTAVQMYVHDNNYQYPGKDWNTAIENYAGSQQIFFCPSDAASDRNSPISYGYSGLLVRPDGTGVEEIQLISPTEVGAIADATPTRVWADGGGLIGGGAMMDPADSSTFRHCEIDPRHTGAIVGFCDGHAKFFPGKTINVKDISSGPGRAFYQAIGLGFIRNYAGGLNNIAVTSTKATVVIGGDAAGMPLLRAVADVWAAKGGAWYTAGFAGQMTPTTKGGKPAAHYAWLDAGDSGTGTPIAQDAFAFIVSRNCKIPVGAIRTDYDTTLAELSSIFCGPEKGYKADTFQAYTLGTKDGSRAYAQSAKVLNGKIGAMAITVRDDYDMVEKVAADPYGIGYCSASVADTDKVTILNLNGKIWPNQNPKYRWLVRDTAASAFGEFEYPLIRTLRLRTKGDGAAFETIMADPEFLNGSLYKTSYYLP